MKTTQSIAERTFEAAGLPLSLKATRTWDYFASLTAAGVRLLRNDFRHLTSRPATNASPNGDLSGLFGSVTSAGGSLVLNRPARAVSRSDFFPSSDAC